MLKRDVMKARGEGRGEGWGWVVDIVSDVM